ncbi:MAG: DNA-methyltransferase [Candidatus Heimdallarchaeaceae archaeon]
MKTIHCLFFTNSNNMVDIPSQSVDLVVTSPPYPMIEMWDEIFSEMNPEIEKALESFNGALAFELMNKELDKVWDEVDRVLKPGAIVCINIGDATRKLGKDFCLYSNHARIINYFLSLGYMCLPEILWRKQTNAPTKFMGSGMLPPGAYVTLEHEHILIFRKGSKREFKDQKEKLTRLKSAYFWEERNEWFSDLWDFKGISQSLKETEVRNRSAAFPFELAYRLVNMFSIKGDIVLDPFLGTGTTSVAAMVSARNSIGVEIDPKLQRTITEKMTKIKSFANKYIENRIQRHRDFIEQRVKKQGELKYTNKYYGFPVMTKQEIELYINKLKAIRCINKQTFECEYLTEEESPSFHQSKVEK